MYEIGESYIFETSYYKSGKPNSIFYTGKIIDLKNNFIEIKTIRGETVFLNINNINQVRKIDEKNDLNERSGMNERKQKY